MFKHKKGSTIFAFPPLSIVERNWDLYDDMICFKGPLTHETGLESTDTNWPTLDSTEPSECSIDQHGSSCFA